MIRSLMLATAALTVLSVTACNREAEPEEVVQEGIASGRAPAGTETVVEVEAPGATTAAGFVTRAALSDLYEIDSSRLALERSQSAPVKAFAQRMIDEHTRMSNEMKAAIAQAGLEARPPTVLDAERTELMRALRDASPADFDDRYIDQQTEAHENTLNLFRDFSGNGDNDQLKALATRAAPMIETHLQTVRALDEGAADDATGAPRPATSN